jgi:hypothetical protein
MTDIGEPVRRHTGVPRYDPVIVPDGWPEPAPTVDPVQPLPTEPAEPLPTPARPLVPA